MKILEQISTDEFSIHKEGENFVLTNDEDHFVYIDQTDLNQKLQDLWHNPEYHMAQEDFLEQNRLAELNSSASGEPIRVYRDGIEVDPFTDEPIEIGGHDIDVDGPPAFD